jgi:hypothetical protein
MNTPAHLIFGLTAFGKAGRPAVTAAAFAGGDAAGLVALPVGGMAFADFGHGATNRFWPALLFRRLAKYLSDRQFIYSVGNSVRFWRHDARTNCHCSMRCSLAAFGF